MSDPEVQASLQGVTLSSANSINIGRLVPQIVYYYTSYAKLVNDKVIACGDKVNFVVPTGNFGDILAGYMAECLGLPVGRLICASNTNNVLTDFLKTGVYSIKRPFHTTMSPSMDILISSNLERLLFMAQMSFSHSGTNSIQKEEYLHSQDGLAPAICCPFPAA